MTKRRPHRIMFMMMTLLLFMILAQSKAEGVCIRNTYDINPIQETRLTKMFEEKKLDNTSTKELLYYLLFTDGDEKLEKDREAFKDELCLTDELYMRLCDVAAESRKDISNTDHEENNISSRNEKVLRILMVENQKLELILKEKYNKYLNWIKKWWCEEQNRDLSGGNKSKSLKNAGDKKKKVYVYATQFDADTSNEVALPDKYVKFSTINLTGKIPENKRKYYNKKFHVSISYDTVTMMGVPVRDVGPWNTNDNYWDSKNANNPRRKFKDLDRFVPEAQAAFRSGYNNGKDESGRIVTNPAGIDLCLTLAKKLGFKKNASHWVYVDMSELP